MGGKITSDSYLDYQGQRIYFCCPGCGASFLEDPDKYFEQASKDKIMFENVQTTCPVMGNPIDKKFFTYYKGRGIYFCCASCIEKFNADPELYLKKMREAEMKAEMKGEMKGMKHDGMKEEMKGGEKGEEDHKSHDHGKDS
jgi:YHS domain-containing protein